MSDPAAPPAVSSALLEVFRRTGSLAGQDFFGAFAHTLADALDARAVLVTEFDQRDDAIAHVVASCDGGERRPSFSYRLVGTPCARLRADDFLLYRFGAGKIFPAVAGLVEWPLEGFAGVLLRARGGRPIGAVSVLHDRPLEAPETIEECVRFLAARASSELEWMLSERALRETAEHFRMLVDNSEELLYVREEDGTFRYVSPSVERLTGYPPHEYVDRAARILDWHNDDTRAAKAIWERQRGGDRSEVPVYRMGIVHRDGKPRTHEIYEHWVEDAWNRHVLVGVAVDVTDKIQLEKELARTRNMESLGRMAGGIAHDFNNILTAITGFANLGLAETEASAPLASYLQRILKSSDRAAGLVRQLMAFAQRQPIDLRPENLDQVVASSLEMLQGVAGERVDLQFVPAPEPWAVEVDHASIEQALANLVVNAAQAMPDGGTVTLSVENVPGAFGGRDAVRLSVADTGVGMDADTLEHVFEPFFTTRGPGGGSGLGLASVHGIVVQCGGTVTVASEPQSGTRFDLLFPRSATEPVAARADDGAALEGSETVLLVEDEESVRQVTQLILTNLGYTVLEAPDGLRGLEVARAHEGAIHLLLTDAVMPGMDGLTLAEELLAERPDTRALLISGYTQRSDVRERGIPFLRKPFDAVKLSRKVREVLDS